MTVRLDSIATAHESQLQLPNWPALMDEETAAAYLGVGVTSFRAIAAGAGARPVDLGLRLLRWRKSDLDRVVEALPLRGETLPPCHPPEAAIDLALAAVARRSAKKGGPRRRDARG